MRILNLLFKNNNFFYAFDHLQRNRFSTSMANSMIELLVSPTKCLQDEPIGIKVKGLNPDQTVTISAFLTDEKDTCFCSHSHYRATRYGNIDFSKAASLGGSYSGVFPMGLLSSLNTAPHEKKFTRYFKRDVKIPTKVIFHVQDGHLSLENVLELDENPPLASCVHEREYIGPGVQQIEVEDSEIKGRLYLPAGDGPFPAVVDLFGSAGGLLDFRAAQLASRGVAALALPYFGYKDLPTDLSELNFNYFEKAVKYLLNHEKVMKPNIGAIGVSKGGDIALAMATFIPEVTAVVSINGCISSVDSKLKLKDQEIQGLKFEISRMKVIDKEVIDCFEAMNNPLEYPDTIIPIEKANAQFLFVVGGMDRNWKSVEYLKMAIDRLQKSNKSNYKVLNYPAAGHLIEPPYSPFCKASYHRLAGAALLWGGELKPHTDAQVHCWPTMIKFLINNLTQSAKL